MPNPTDSPESLGAHDKNSALFANLVIQQANMAMMLLGKIAHPDTGKPIKDLEAAQLFIDHLEMLEVKTRGNLNADESALLKQSLMSLRMAFVDATNETAPSAPPAPAAEGGKSPAKPEGGIEPGAAAEEGHKKFSKKY